MTDEEVWYALVPAIERIGVFSLRPAVCATWEDSQ